MTRALILITDCRDWEALYIDGTAIVQSDKLEEGNRLYLVEIAEAYGLRSSDFSIKYAGPLDNSDCGTIGVFPNTIYELKDKYE